jgi:hypothetical protein
VRSPYLLDGAFAVCSVSWPLGCQVFLKRFRERKEDC